MSHFQESHFADFESLKDVPGFQAILKAILKSQIQHLVEQLSEQTGEESVLLTANVAAGTLSHLGSSCGKYFIDDHEQLKSQFFGFCLNCKASTKRKREGDTEPEYDLTAPAKNQKAHENSMTGFSTPKQPANVLKAARVVTTQANEIPPNREPFTELIQGSSHKVNLKEYPLEKVTLSDDVIRDIESEFSVERNIESDSLTQTIDTDQVCLPVTTDDDVYANPCHNIKREPHDDNDKFVANIETSSSSVKEKSLEIGGGKKKPQRLGHFPKTHLQSLSTSTGQSTESGSSTLNPMLSDVYLHDVLSQISTKTAQLSEITLDTGLTGTVVVPPRDKPFRCHLCGRGFTQRGNLEVHMWTQHGNK